MAVFAWRFRPPPSTHTHALRAEVRFFPNKEAALSIINELRLGAHDVDQESTWRRCIQSIPAHFFRYVRVEPTATQKRGEGGCCGEASGDYGGFKGGGGSFTKS